jgi:hypothetical protein
MSKIITPRSCKLLYEFLFPWEKKLAVVSELISFGQSSWTSLGKTFEVSTAKNLGSAPKRDECFAQYALARPSANWIAFGFGKQVSIAKFRLSIFSAWSAGSIVREKAKRSK